MIGFWLMLVLFVMLLAVGPWWPHSRGWGYGPAAVLLAVLLIWMMLIWLGWIAFLLPWGAAVAAALPAPPGGGAGGGAA